MALQITNGSQVKLYFNVAGQLAMNVMGAIPGGTVVFNQALADTLGAAIKSAWVSQLGTHMGANVQLIRVGVRDLRVANLPEFRDTGTVAVGGAATDTLPGATAMCITLRTAKAGKSFRGRVFLAGFAEGDNQATGTSSVAAGTASVGFLQAVSSAMTTSGLTFAVLSYPSEDKVIELTTTHADGSKSVRRLSHEIAKVGGATAVTTIENRTAAWESQRRRVNNRGVAPAALDARVSVSI